MALFIFAVSCYFSFIMGLSCYLGMQPVEDLFNSTMFIVYGLIFAGNFLGVTAEILKKLEGR